MRVQLLPNWTVATIVLCALNYFLFAYVALFAIVSTTNLSLALTARAVLALESVPTVASLLALFVFLRYAPAILCVFGSVSSWPIWPSELRSRSLEFQPQVCDLPAERGTASSSSSLLRDVSVRAAASTFRQTLAPRWALYGVCTALSVIMLIILVAAPKATGGFLLGVSFILFPILAFVKVNDPTVVVNSTATDHRAGNHRVETNAHAGTVEDSDPSHGLETSMREPTSVKSTASCTGDASTCPRALFSCPIGLKPYRDSTFNATIGRWWTQLFASILLLIVCIGVSALVVDNADGIAAGSVIGWGVVILSTALTAWLIALQLCGARLASCFARRTAATSATETSNEEVEQVEGKRPTQQQVFKRDAIPHDATAATVLTAARTVSFQHTFLQNGSHRPRVVLFVIDAVFFTLAVILSLVDVYNLHHAAEDKSAENTSQLGLGVMVAGFIVVPVMLLHSGFVFVATAALWRRLFGSTTQQSHHHAQELADKAKPNALDMKKDRTPCGDDPQQGGYLQCTVESMLWFSYLHTLESDDSDENITAAESQNDLDPVPTKSDGHPANDHRRASHEENPVVTTSRCETNTVVRFLSLLLPAGCVVICVGLAASGYDPQRIAVSCPGRYPGVSEKFRGLSSSMLGFTSDTTSTSSSSGAASSSSSDGDPFRLMYDALSFDRVMYDVKPPKVPYSVCSQRWGPASWPVDKKLTISDVVAITAMNYFSDIESAVKILFPNDDVVVEHKELHESTSDPSIITLSFNNRSETERIVFVVVRGSKTGHDWVQSAAIAGEAVIAHLASVFLPLPLFTGRAAMSSVLSLSSMMFRNHAIPSYVDNTLHKVTNIRNQMYAKYFDEVREFYTPQSSSSSSGTKKKPQRPYFMISGHSLGGHVAGSVGAALHMPSVGLAPLGWAQDYTKPLSNTAAPIPTPTTTTTPGAADVNRVKIDAFLANLNSRIASELLWDSPMDAETAREVSTSVWIDGDLVPVIGSVFGARAIVSPVKSCNMLSCHSTRKLLHALVESCGDPLGRAIQEPGTGCADGP